MQRDIPLKVFFKGIGKFIDFANKFLQFGSEVMPSVGTLYGITSKYVGM